MRIALQKRNSLAYFHHADLGRLLRHLAEERFHPRPIDQQNVRIGQPSHVARRQLVIVQTPDMRAGQIGNLHARNSSGDIQRGNIDRIKRGHNTQRLVGPKVRGPQRKDHGNKRDAQFDLQVISN